MEEQHERVECHGSRGAVSAPVHRPTKPSYNAQGMHYIVLTAPIGCIVAWIHYIAYVLAQCCLTRRRHGQATALLLLLLCSPQCGGGTEAVIELSFIHEVNTVNEAHGNACSEVQVYTMRHTPLVRHPAYCKPTDWQCLLHPTPLTPLHSIPTAAAPGGASFITFRSSHHSLSGPALPCPPVQCSAIELVDEAGSWEASLLLAS